MELKIWTRFGKKINSTAQPDETINIPYVVNVQFKESSSILSPVFLLNLKQSLPTIDPAEINYCYASTFHRYYWVNDITIMPGAIWSISCRVDVLASYKDHIGAVEAYVLRSSHRFNDYIIDRNYPITTNRSVADDPAERPLFAFSYENGTYIIGVVTGGAAAQGGVQYYAFSYTAFGDFVHKLLSNVDWVDINVDEISQGLQKALFDPTQYITKSFWLPIPYAAVASAGSGESVTSIPYGWWTISDISAYKISYNSFIRTGQSRFVRFISHPQRSITGLRYLDSYPYREIYLSCPPFCRDLQLPSDVLINYDELFLSTNVDITTGEAVLFIVPRRTDDTAEYPSIMELRASVSVPIPIHVATQDLLGGVNHVFQTARSALSSVGGLFSGNVGGTLEEIGNVASGVASALESFTPDITTVGSGGRETFIDIIQRPVLRYKFSMIAEENKDLFGRPFCRTVPLATNPGFNKCARTPFPGTAATLEERREIENYLEGGFYFE